MKWLIMNIISILTLIFIVIKIRKHHFFPPITSLKTFLFFVFPEIAFSSLLYCIMNMIIKKSITWCYNYYIWKRAQKKRKRSFIFASTSWSKQYNFLLTFHLHLCAVFLLFPVLLHLYRNVRQSMKWEKITGGMS